MRVLVTGATGFFGCEIVNKLRGDGHIVDGAARHPNGIHATIQLDITDSIACRRVFSLAHYDAVVHAAALAHVRGAVDAEYCFEINARGAANVVSAAASCGVEHYIFISSVAVYGDYALESIVTEEAERRATGVYGCAKIAAEDATLSKQSSMRCTILRMASMYAHDWLFNIRKRVVFPWFRHCYFRLEADKPRYSLCSRATGIDVISRLLKEQIESGIYNVADHYVYTQEEIRQAVIRIEGDGITLPIPKVLAWSAWKYSALFSLNDNARVSAFSRYWKFCERNVYSVARLASLGVPTPADLLMIGEK